MSKLLGPHSTVSRTIVSCEQTLRRKITQMEPFAMFDRPRARKIATRVRLASLCTSMGATAGESPFQIAAKTASSFGLQLWTDHPDVGLTWEMQVKLVTNQGCRRRRDRQLAARDDRSFAVQWLACAFPCRRFAGALADVCARLRADVDRYLCFIVRDLHPLLLAGLPAHSDNLHTSRRDMGAARGQTWLLQDVSG